MKLTDRQIMLWALNKLNRYVYEGTVPPEVKAKRRAKNKQARLDRRKNR